MPERLVFVSCGQLTDDERRLGQLIKAEVDATEGYSAYFADAVQSLRGLSEHVFDALRRCSGAVVVLHPRGYVKSDNGGDLGVRSSVWINQEVAILAYRKFFEGADIPVLAFKDPAVQLEGAMTAFIVNPHPLVDEKRVLEETRTWLQTAARTGREDMQEVFEAKWAEVTGEGRDVLAALTAEGGHHVKDTSVRQRLIAPGIDKNRASGVLREQRLFLSQKNLVRLTRNTYDGDEMSLHPTWEWYVRHELKKLT